MDIDNIQSVIDVARASGVPQVIHEGAGKKIVVVPGNGQFPSEVKIVDFVTDLPAPLRKKGAVNVFDVASLNKLMAENIGGDITVYVDRDARKPAIVAVLNGGGKTGPGWADHRISIAFRSTPQWVKWSGIDGKFLSQSDFANFIEDNLLDVRDPAPADMLEISQFLEVTRTTNFKSVTRPKTGLLQFKNESNDTTADDMRVPDIIKLFLAPLFGVAPMLIDARFRYRIKEGALTLGIKMQRVEEIMAQIIEEMVAEIALPEGAVMVEGVAP